MREAERYLYNSAECQRKRRNLFFMIHSKIGRSAFSLLFFSLPLFSFCQKNVQSNVVVSSDTTSRTSKLIFNNGSELPLLSCNFSISPDSQYVAVIYYAYPNQNQTKTEIFNSNGEIVRTYFVEPFGGIILGNDGRFLVYGAPPSEEISDGTSFAFYYSTGERIYRNFKPMGFNIKCKFTCDGILLILGEPHFLAKAMEGRLNLFVLDNKFDQLSFVELKNLSRESDISNYDYNPNDKEETIAIETYNRDNGIKKTEILVYGISGELKRREVKK
jgi:hypothetical protein